MALHHAAITGDVAAAQAAIHAGVDVNALDANGVTALLLAAHKGHAEVVKFLLTVPGIQVNLADRKGDAPIVFAIAKGYEAVVALLARHPGIDLTKANANGVTPLAVAAKSSPKLLALLEHGSDSKAAEAPVGHAHVPETPPPDIATGAEVKGMAAWPTALQVVGDAKSEITATVLAIMNRERIKNRDKLPGPLAGALTRRALRNVVLSSEFVVCEKSDGERAMLLVWPTGTWHGIWLIDRNFDCWRLATSTEVDFPRAWSPEGVTLLDGELIINRRRAAIAYHYLIFDALQVNGQSVVDSYLPQRLDAVRQNFLRAVLSLASTPLNLYLKNFVGKEHIRTVFDCIRHYSNGDIVYSDETRACGNDGIVFTPLNQPYFPAPGTLLKWKWLEENTIDFAIPLQPQARHPEVTWSSGGVATVPLELWAGEWAGENHHVPSTTASLSAAELEGLRRECEALPPMRTSIIVECAFSVHSGTWSIKRTRRDKTTANFVKVAFETMQVMVENITKDELLRILRPSGAGAGAAAGGAAAGAGPAKRKREDGQ